MSTRSSSKPSAWTTIGALVVLLGMQGTAALAEPANHPARSDAVRVADRGHRPAARPQRPQMPHGDYARHTEVQRTSNAHTSHSTVTGANGRSATRDSTVVNDRAAGTRTRDTTYTGPEGRTRTVNDVTTRTNDGHTRQTTYTDAQGRTATREATVVNDRDAGTRTRDVTYTGRDGQERVVHDVAQRTDDGYTRNSTYTNAHGETATRSATVSCDKAAGKCTKDVQVDAP
jgi:hypothetical protein